MKDCKSRIGIRTVRFFQAVKAVATFPTTPVVDVTEYPIPPLRIHKKLLPKNPVGVISLGGGSKANPIAIMLIFYHGLGDMSRKPGCGGVSHP